MTNPRPPIAISDTAFLYEHSDIAPGMTLVEWRRELERARPSRRLLRDLLCGR